MHILLLHTHTNIFMLHSHRQMQTDKCFWFTVTCPHTTQHTCRIKCSWSLVLILLRFPRCRTPAMIGCSFVANRDYFGELGLLDSGMDVYGGENIELGIRVCVSPSFLLFLLPFYPCRFKWSSGHRSVAPLINEAPLGVLEDQPRVCSSQQGNGDK